jgi:cell division protein FtsL
MGDTVAHTISRKARWMGVLEVQQVRSRRDLRDMRFFYSTVLAVALLVAVLFVYLWSRLMMVNIGYDISKVNLKREALIESNRRLSIEMERLRSPERIEAIALNRLDLIHPKREQIIRLR